MQQPSRGLSWFIFIILSLIWGSSFILMKEGLTQLTPYQVAALRMVAAGLVLVPVAIKSFAQIPAPLYGYVFLSGLLGSFFPAFLFCIAEEGIDSSLAGTLNALTPIFVIVTGTLFFQLKPGTRKIVGVMIAFTGTVLLLISKGHMQESRHLYLTALVVLATLMYGFNVNMVGRKLHHIPSLQIASVALVLNAIPSLAVLGYTGYFKLSFTTSAAWKASGAAIVLGVAGTAVATILFYMLVKRAGGVFASTVTYGIPFVAIGWGIYFHESFGWAQLAALLVILTGVFIANKK